MNNIRNIAIIAHVDHGKTTLVDALLHQSKATLGKQFSETSSLIMDSNDLEKERGITIFSKNASVDWKGTKINIIDTPGHADFGGEVERVLKMADGCLLLVDAKEGPMPQTRFVLKQALQMGHKVIVVVNKIDRPDARVSYVLDKTFDLFLELGADEDAAYFPTVYCSGKLGKAGLTPDINEMSDISPVFDAILEYVPAPKGSSDLPLQMLVTNISADNYKGRIATGRIYNGTLKVGQDIIHINRAGEHKKFRLTSLMIFRGLERIDSTEVFAGDIVSVAGIPNITIGETITDVSQPEPLPLLNIEEPTVRMTFSVNSSPFAGKEGEFKTSRQIHERLHKELETDVALKVEDCPGGWVVSGRGELHLAILIERMRREGYEFQISRPQVIEKQINGETLTPFERILIEVPEEHSGVVIQKLGLRHAQLQDMSNENGVVFMEFIISTKELFGYRHEFVTDTHGLGIMNTAFFEYKKSAGAARARDRGSLVAHETGVSKLYGLISAQERGDLFIGPAVPVYGGEVIGQSARSGDLRINICKEKQQTNHRSSGDGVAEHFNTPKIIGLEIALEYIDDTELVEVTPQNIRIRKINLNAH